MRKTLLFPSILFLALFAACYWLSAGSTPRRGAIVFCQDGQIHTLDPAKMTYLQDIRVAQALWEGLAQYAPHTLKPIPGQAKSWSISKNGLVYRFYLKPNARWSNGQPVTSRDFLFEWKRVLHPHTGSGYVFLYFHIAGAQKYFNSIAAHPHHHLPFSTVGIKAPNRRTLVVTLTHPCPYFLDLMAFPPFFPLDYRVMQHFRENEDGQTGYNPIWTRPPHLVTNGAYRLTDWRFHQFLELTPNPYYDQRSQVHCPLLKIVNYQDSTAAFLAYQSGVIDVVGFVPNSLGPALVKQEQAGLRHDVHVTPVFGTMFLDLNCQKGVLKNRLIREALDMAIDRRALVRHVVRMPTIPVHVLIPPNTIPGYRSPKGVGFNVAEARRLLAQAGYPGGRGMKPLRYLVVAGYPLMMPLAEAIGAMWQKNLGVRIHIISEEGKIFHEECLHGRFDVAGDGWYGDYPDPSTWLDLFLTGNPNNMSHYSSPMYDRLLQKASQQPSARARFHLMHQAEAFLVDQAFPAIPLFQVPDGMVYNRAKIGGIKPNTRLLTLLKYIHRR